MNPELPGTYVNLLVEVIQKWNVSSEQLLSGTGISAQTLSAPFWYVDFEIFNHLLEKAALLTHEPALSLYLAEQMRISCYGHVGIAATASETLGDAIKILEQFIGLHCSVFQPKLKIQAEMAYLYFHQPSPKFKLNQQGTMFLILGFSRILENLVQHKLAVHFQFQQQQPSFYKNTKIFNDSNVSFECEKDCLTFNKALLLQPLKTADALLARLSKQQCEQDASKLSLKRRQKDSLDAQVKTLLYHEEDGFLSLKQVAEKLHLSERTLQRQLSNQQTSFQILVAEVRRKQAERLLKQPKLSIEQIAERLGYADISHFSRAFKKWTNVTPKFYRQVSIGHSLF
ncbi:AraC family transcriptional regulator [Acinetobacter sp. ANC 3882]|uniref:AraC family transcriptional regulator n=1 Tax=Acinetobacter sp. ANC 3882 TaxID=2923423 RepID=UPI001F4B8BC9|nr:AraC family transcriptional regulator [Acinetobacter sp. ANC 3882]MCH7313125.1 AraC family transcriptional regulator [Acinetobacter sp. ANC 3882]